jgi:REP element-mobilizing transposase RayT
MTRARKQLISLDATSYYHCVSRCVRRAFLCGQASSGKNYEHRRQWIEDKIYQLSEIFAIDLCAYAIMHNHYHLVLHVAKKRSQQWSDKEVVIRWHQLFKGTPLTHQFLKQGVSKSSCIQTSVYIKIWRDRLANISWYMKILNQRIAIASNQEDECTGRFWEGRFKSQALLDEKALFSCMAYVDLNPIRAKIAKSPSESEFTSIAKRIKQVQKSQQLNQQDRQAYGLKPFRSGKDSCQKTCLPFQLNDYLQLVDWSGRHLCQEGRGKIPDHVPNVLTQLEIMPNNWLYLSKNFESPFKHLVGAAHNMQEACERLKQRWAHGLRDSRRIFSLG